MDEIPEFDAPVFKQLSKNDSGQGDNNQAGFVIPIELYPYFPPLVKSDTETAPGVQINAILVVANKEVGLVQTRYQLQTWGKARKGEHRITGNLAPLRGLSGPYQRIACLVSRLGNHAFYPANFSWTPQLARKADMESRQEERRVPVQETDQLRILEYRRK